MEAEWTLNLYLLLQRPHPSLQAAGLAPIKCAMATFSLCSNVTTGLLTGMIKNIPYLASCFTWGSVATCSAGLLKYAVLSISMAWGIKATLLCAHGPTILTNPEPCSTVRTFSPPAPRVHSNQAHPRRVSMPSCNDSDYNGLFQYIKIHPHGRLNFDLPFQEAWLQPSRTN